MPFTLPLASAVTVICPSGPPPLILTVRLFRFVFKFLAHHQRHCHGSAERRTCHGRQIVQFDGFVYYVFGFDGGDDNAVVNQRLY